MANDRYLMMTFAKPLLWLLVLSFLSVVAFLFFFHHLLDKFYEQVEIQRRENLMRVVSVARNAVEPILAEVRSGALSPEEARQRVRDLVRTMTYEDQYGRNYIFMSAYDGTILVQPFESTMEMSNQWNLQDDHGTFIVQELIKAARSNPKGSFVHYSYHLPGVHRAQDKMAFVVGLPELQSYIGTGMYLQQTMVEQTKILYQARHGAVGLILLILVPIVGAGYALVQRNRLLFAEIQRRRQAEEKLRGSEARYRELVENAKTIILHFDLEGRIVFANEFTEKLFGYTHEEMIGRSVMETIVPPIESTGRDLKELIDRIVQDPGSHTTSVNENIDKSGRRHWMLWKNRPILDPLGKIQGIVSIGSDITELRSTQEALGIIERRYREIVETAYEGIVVMDSDFTVAFANHRMAEMLGYPIEALLGKSVETFLFEEDLAEHREMVTRRRQGISSVYERRFQHKDGNVVWALVSVTPTKDAAGRFTGAIAMITDISEQKRKEEALKQSEGLLRKVLDALPVGVWIVDANGQIRMSNPAGQEIWAGMHYVGIEQYGEYKAWRSDTGERVKAEEWSIARLLRAGEIVLNEELEIEAFDGTRKIILNSALPVHNEQGNLIAAIAVNQDITERRMVERAVQESEERFRMLYEQAPLGYQSLDEEGRLLEINEAWTRLLGYSRDEALGRWFGSFLTPPSVEFFGQQFPCFRDSGELSGARFEMVRKDGSVAIIDIDGKIGHDKLGRFKQTHCVLRDVTQQQRTEAALKESEERYRNLFEAAPIPLEEEDFSEVRRCFERMRASGVKDWNAYFEEHPQEVFNLNSMIRVVTANKAALTLFQARDVEEFRSRFSEIVPPEAHDQLKEALVAIAEGKPRSEMEVLNRTLRGEPRYLQLKWIVAPGYERDMSKVLVSAVDLTERKRLETQLSQMQKMDALGTLAGGIAHDFNNILAAIIGYTEMTLHDSSLHRQGKLKSNVEQVLASALRARDLVRQILIFSRQQDEQKKAPVELAPIIEEAVRFLRASIPSTIHIRTSIQAPFGRTLADPTQIHQILMNLGANAAQAMEEKGGVLTIGLEEVELDSSETTEMTELKSGAYLKLTVSDTGCGMEPATVEKVFDPYFTTKVVGKGSGLGLAVVHGIVKRHAGAIMVCSAPGQGSTFKVLLPKAQLEGKEPKAEVKLMPNGNQERILLVDDEPTLVELGRQMLHHMGYAVEATTDSREALEWVRQSPGRFDLVITDYTMPGMTGEDLAREILRIHPDMPIILTSGFSERINEERINEIGIREFLMKPLSMHDLAQAVRRVLNSS